MRFALKTVYHELVYCSIVFLISASAEFLVLACNHLTDSSNNVDSSVKRYKFDVHWHKIIPVFDARSKTRQIVVECATLLQPETMSLTEQVGCVVFIRDLVPAKIDTEVAGICSH